MKALIMLLFCLLSAGCSMEVVNTPQTLPLRLQSSRTSSVQAVTPIVAADLQPGDMLLSSATSITSQAIRLVSMTGVSHAAIYLGDELVAEATGKGVGIIPLSQAIAESNNLLALRLENFSAEDAGRLRDYALARQGEKYNYKGIVMLAPFMLSRRLCELPLFYSSLRHQCLSMLASVQVAEDETSTSFFCSQFVAAAYAYAGHPLFDGQPGWLSPADLLHMRAGDVSSYRQKQSLIYVGHLKRWNVADILGFRR
ncbi:YaeF family permuted papain-like enzyme [Mixta tenebrionis]|uniref:YaeF family permuted papain-like enzyme n=1 Tax=Mixta tenebrionis TaxID=2562439 RepID=A0A506V9B5_9GAMM|nr:YaeF family permuted papain-like enzyme [Mixta tenebrionis]QHM74447.1 hypothetical protein C7M52_00382 [Mixta theicola]TPW42524.1 YaeF family permuted papain-like enzyme [Mixta tenebrionis]